VNSAGETFGRAAIGSTYDNLSSSSGLRMAKLGRPGFPWIYLSGTQEIRNYCSDSLLSFLLS
jgi:hypothetical protein